MKYLTNSYAQIRTYLLLAISVLIMTGCGGGGGGGASSSNDTNSLRFENLRSITISSANQAVHLGTNEQFTAVGHYSNGESADITSQVTWLSSDTSKATISNETNSKGLVTPVAVGITNITATYGEISSDPSSLTISSAILKQIAITPEVTTTHLGIPVQFTLVGIYSDNTNQKITSGATWKSEYTTIATINESGLATPVSEGLTTITATYSGLSATAKLTVSKAQLNEIVIDPQNAKAPLGPHVNYTATGIYSDGSKQGVGATWTSSESTVATINSATGEAIPVAVGHTEIKAEFGGLSATTKLTVNEAKLSQLVIFSPTTSSPRGVEVQYTATGLYTDGSSHDLTGQVVWYSSESSVATINHEGKATPLTVGNTKISATSNGVSSSNSLDLNVTQEVLSQIIIEPAHATTPAGLEVQYTATGIYTDGSHHLLSSGNGLTWGSSDPSVAAIDASSGTATTLKQGVTTITATFTSPSGSSQASTSLTVSAATLDQLVLTPKSTTTPMGMKVQYTLIGIYSDGSNQTIPSDTVTWKSSDTSVATVDQNGLATPVAVGGPTTITAKFNGLSATATLNISAATLSQVIIEPTDKVTPLGVTVQYTATGIFSDNTYQTLTGVTWTSSNTAKATIDQNGLATPVALGSTTITATIGSVSASTNLTVDSAQITSLLVEPADTSTHVGVNVKYTAFAKYSDGRTENVTSAATWLSSESSVATINPDTGEASPVTAGDTTIKATFNGISSTGKLKVLAAALTDIIISPSDTATPLGVPVHYTATGRYTDGKEQVITSEVTWTSSNVAVASIVASTGVATPVGVGNTDITAMLSGKTATAKLQVNDATLDKIDITPADSTAYVGVKHQFTATGRYSDGTTRDITTSVIWTVADNIATINLNGLLTPKSPGKTKVKVIYQDGTQKGETNLTINPSAIYENSSSFVADNTGISSLLYSDTQMGAGYINKSDNHAYTISYSPSTSAWFTPSVVGDPASLMTTTSGRTSVAVTPATSPNYPKTRWVAYEDVSKSQIVVTIPNVLGGAELPVLSGRSPSLAYDPRFGRMCLAYHDWANQDVELKCIVKKDDGRYDWEYYNNDNNNEGRQVEGSKDKDHRSVNVHLIFGNTLVNNGTAMPIISFTDPSTKKVTVKILANWYDNGAYTYGWRNLCSGETDNKFGSAVAAKEHGIALQTDKVNNNTIARLYVAYTDTSDNLYVSRCEPTLSLLKKWEFGNVIAPSQSGISIAANPLHVYVASRDYDNLLKLRASTLYEFPNWHYFVGTTATGAPLAPSIRNAPYSTSTVVNSQGIPYVTYVTDSGVLGMMAGQTSMAY